MAQNETPWPNWMKVSTRIHETKFKNKTENWPIIIEVSI